jgi:high frequency lysogenization protein
MSKASIHDLVIALAGVAQAAALTQQIATEGKGDPLAIAGTVHSILKLDADDCDSIFIDKQHLQLGLKTLRDSFDGDKPAQTDILRYCASMLHLQKRLAKNREMLDTLSRRILQIQKQADMAGSETHSNIMSSIAALYLDTISTFQFRIQVNGSQDVLQQPAVAEQIRAMLLGGIRAVTLWRQLGGSRLDFVFKRKAIYETTLALLKA